MIRTLHPASEHGAPELGASGHGAPHGALHGAPRSTLRLGFRPTPRPAHAPVAPSAPCPPLKAGGHGGLAGPRTRANPPADPADAVRHDAHHGAEQGAPHGAPFTAEAVIAALEAAGETLLCLPQGGHTTQLRTSAWRVVHNAAEAYGYAEPGGRLRPPVPSAAAITRMDTALAWLALIPDDKYVLRRIVACRMLVSPHTGRNLYPWRRLGTLLGADHKAIQRWHGQGIALLVRALNDHARV